MATAGWLGRVVARQSRPAERLTLIRPTDGQPARALRGEVLFPPTHTVMTVTRTAAAHEQERLEGQLLFGLSGKANPLLRVPKANNLACAWTHTDGTRAQGVV